MSNENTGKAIFKKIVCPFDLEAIFSLQYSVTGLKSVLEFILEHIGTLDEKQAENLDKINK
jgi:hypothetical protein